MGISFVWRLPCQVLHRSVPIPILLLKTPRIGRHVQAVRLLAGGICRFMAVADSHTASHAPEPFRRLKLSGAGPDQYWGGGLPGKPEAGSTMKLRTLHLRVPSVTSCSAQSPGHTPQLALTGLPASLLKKRHTWEFKIRPPGIEPGTI